MNPKKPIAVVCIVLLTTGLIFASILATPAADAQDSTTSNMQSLLERLAERINDERGFRIFVDFEKPLVGDELTWEIGDPNDELQRRIVEIGEDYLCFQEIALAADGRRCTPFTNIVGIFYLNN